MLLTILLFGLVFLCFMRREEEIVVRKFAVLDFGRFGSLDDIEISKGSIRARRTLLEIHLNSRR